MPIESAVAEAIRKNNGVIPMSKVVKPYWTADDLREYIKTGDGVVIDLDQLHLLFWEYAREDMAQEQMVQYMGNTNALDVAVYANIARMFWYRDHAQDFQAIMDGKKFCDTFAEQIFTHPEVRIAMANILRETAMDIHRKLVARLTQLATPA